jgi:hypothetical protein
VYLLLRLASSPISHLSRNDSTIVIVPPVNYVQAIVKTNYVGGFSNSEYLHRPLEHSLSQLLGHKDNQYVVVVGPKGCGKSTLVNYVTTTNPTGVIPLQLSGNFSDLSGAILEVLGMLKFCAWIPSHAKVF